MLNTYTYVSTMYLPIQGVFEMRAETPTTSHRPRAELGKNTQKILCQKIKRHLFLEPQLF
jgi:hypothetical protein